MTRQWRRNANQIGALKIPLQLTSAASLWVWSQDGLAKQKRLSDPNRKKLLQKSYEESIS
jgi:hypothetical protein